MHFCDPLCTFNMYELHFIFIQIMLLHFVLIKLVRIHKE
jgi:hypothetical protein